MRGVIKRKMSIALLQKSTILLFTRIRNRMQAQKMFVEMVRIGGVAVLSVDNNS